MPIAVSWVQLPPESPFLPVPKFDLPYLDFGTVPPGTYSVPQVIGLRFQGCGVQNIKVWQDGPSCSIYSQDVSAPQLLVASPAVLALVLNTNGSVTTYQTAVQSHDPSAFPAMPTTLGSAISLGDAPLGVNYEAVSAPLAITILAPSTDHVDVRDFRLMAAFETTDSPHVP